MKRIAPEISARVDCLIGNPQNIGRRGRFFYLADNRHNQMQSNAATMRATQLSSIEITCVATITFACLKRRTACPIAIIPKMTDAKGQLLRSGNGFYVSRDGLLATSLDLVADGAYGVAKSSDGKIRNVTGVLDFSKTSGLAILRAETKVGVTFLPLEKTTESIAVNAWGVVVGSTLRHKEQPMASGMMKSLGADPKKDAFQIGGTIPSGAAGAPVVDANGEV